jgi:hypothetical protein
MTTRVYKIKNKQTQEFWAGYASEFTKKGTQWTSWDSAAHAIRAQLSYRHHSIKEWVDEAEIVELTVSVQETDAFPLMEKVRLSAFYSALQDKFGKQFVKNYHKLCGDTPTEPKFKYAVLVAPQKIDDFRTQLKNLGYSSRAFKKTDSWLWITDDDVAVRARLIDGVSQFVNLELEEAEFKALLGDESKVNKLLGL